MPVRTRLSIAVALVTAVLITAGGLLFLRQLERGLDTALDATLQSRADALIQQIGPEGGAGFQDAGAEGLLPPNQTLAQVISGDGILLDSSEGARDGPLLTAGQLDQARREPLSLTTIRKGDSIRLLALPVPNSGQPPVTVVVGTTRALSQQAVRRVRTGLALGGAAAVILCAAGAWMLANAALRPVQRMRRQADAITAGDTGARLSVPATRDEVAQLGSTMNALLQRLHESLTRQRQFVADAGHELRTPLTYLRAELELAARPGRTAAELRAAVSRAAEDTDRLIRLAESLLLLARADDQLRTMIIPTPVRIDALLQQAATAARPQARASRRFITVDSPNPVIIDGDPDCLRQIIDNLLDNALRFTPPGGTVRLTAAASASGEVVVDVSDDGPGFPPDFLPHAFERFRRADLSRTPGPAGTGLGLAIVASLTQAHGGTVTAVNLVPRGARVRVRLPAAGPA